MRRKSVRAAPVLGHKVVGGPASTTANARRAQASTRTIVQANGAYDRAAPAANGHKKVVVAVGSTANAPPEPVLHAPTATPIATNAHAAPGENVPLGRA